MKRQLQNKFVRFLNDSLSSIQGKKEFNSFFKTLYYLSLNGLNYGKAHSLVKDGELFQMKKIQSSLKDKNPIVIFDVGANEGHYSKLVLEIFNANHPGLHLFEPSVETFNRLKNNLQSSTLTFNNFGFSDKNERVTLYKSKKGSVYASVYESDRSDYIESIELRTLDDYCDQHNIGHIDFLKIDVEGHEFKCLLGADKMLREGRIQFIQFEFGVSNIYSRVFFKDIYDLLRSRGYSVGRVLKNGIADIAEYHPSLEVFLTTNYLARYSD